MDMGKRSLVAAVLWILCGGVVWAQGGGNEIPIEKCDVLPVVRLKIDGAEMRFLLDTGATTVLNLESFSSGRSKAIEITSWKGTAETSARGGRGPESAMGTHALPDSRWT